ncbi:hypothetical protein C8259_01225 [Nocardia nova]|uniref:Uncharacterized protein n=1 Tax=Nocardia nova TaxID=37330 RepID=A0A2T2ZE57_9NOCA|nr:hypothetical protein C8259_01225 [Nocardia nova]
MRDGIFMLTIRNDNSYTAEAWALRIKTVRESKRVTTVLHQLILKRLCRECHDVQAIRSG